jgi:predicted RNA-binding protein YlxR (DUF448 family)
MARKAKGPRPKHIPQRTCIACRETGGKRGLVRLVRTQDGVRVDPSSKLPGRGAYLHPSRDCWNVALNSRRIQQALRTNLSEEDRLALVDYAKSLPQPDASSEPAEPDLSDDTPKDTPTGVIE